MFDSCMSLFYTIVVIFVLLFWAVKFLNWQKHPKSKVCLVEKTAIVTGANRGIGFEVALALAMRGCRVIIACRNNLEESMQKIKNTTKNPNIVGIHLDLLSLSSVRKFAKQITETENRLDILIHNAGIVKLDEKVTEDGLNPIVQVSHFGPFLLTHLLAGLMRKTGSGRIIYVSSLIAYLHNLTLETLNPPYEGNSSEEIERLYMNNKLCNIISAIEFSKKLKQHGITVNAVHPGLVLTSIFDQIRSPSATWKQKLLLAATVTPAAKTPEEGSFAIVDVATDDCYQHTTGEFLYDGWSLWIPRLAKDVQLCKKIWELSEECVKLRPEERL